MKLASFHAGGRDRIGIVAADERLVDIAASLEAIAGVAEAPRTMLELIEAGPAMLDRLAAAFDGGSAGEAWATDEVTFHPPVRRPSKLCCLALNNSANAERIMSGPKHPAMFIKPASALIGHGAAIECRPEYGRCHPEPELAVIIGRRAKNVAAADAYDHVFGYTIHNDITSPTMREEDTFHYRAIHPKADDPAAIDYVDTWVSYSGRYKGCDTFAPMGPWLVTRDEVSDPHALAVVCRHKGTVVTEDSTANLFFKIPEVIAFLSRSLTLEPGDVVSMGTALKASGGGGAVQNVDLNRLGGPVSVTIEGLGTLENPAIGI